MRYTSLGRSGLRVSRLCLGTMNFGPNTGEKDSFAIMDMALDAGINFFDTANIYGARNGGHAGWTEEIMGRWFAQGGGRRNKIALATKFYADMGDAGDGPNGADGLSAFKMRRHLEGSLRRLQTDHVELYQMHHRDDRATWEEIWGAYEALIGEGKLLYAGSSNFGARHMVKAQWMADRRNFLGLVSEQHRYNLLCRLPELEVVPAARELGIGLVIWSPLGMGMLSGSLLKSVEDGQRSKKYVGKVSGETMGRLQAYQKLCDGLGEAPANVALAWLLANPAVACPIVGPRTPEQLQGALRAAEIELAPETMAELDRIFPGPGGEGPEAYSRG
ncbi:MAG: aldo/keto reductase [Clostridiales bacterium]|nr:aldo/keto reductase [Clostridiales bacterium]